jgi:hypothetical protein
MVLYNLSRTGKMSSDLVIIDGFYRADFSKAIINNSFEY